LVKLGQKKDTTDRRKKTTDSYYGLDFDSVDQHTTVWQSLIPTLIKQDDSSPARGLALHMKRNDSQ
jgi:hypothetical protein